MGFSGLVVPSPTPAPSHWVALSQAALGERRAHPDCHNYYPFIKKKKKKEKPSEIISGSSKDTQMAPLPNPVLALELNTCSQAAPFFRVTGGSVWEFLMKGESSGPSLNHIGKA